MIKRIIMFGKSLRSVLRPGLLQGLVDALAQTNLRVDAIEQRLQAIDVLQADLLHKLLGQVSEHAQSEALLNEQQQMMLKLMADQQQLRRDWRATLIGQEQAILAAARSVAVGGLPESPKVAVSPAREALYRRFEDAHHLEWKVRERKMFYLPDARSAAQRLQGRILLDIGCGRGEWLSMLRDAGVPARGVDINPAMAETARAEGIDIAIADGIEFLRRQEAGSLAAVTAFHLIEHLPFEVFLSLLEGAWRALAPGGVLILETPNPENFMVGACNFWMDPTHLRPLPPELIKFHVEACGYADVRVRRFRLQEDLHDSMTENEPAPSALRPEEWLHAGYDYGIVAIKPLR